MRTRSRYKMCRICFVCSKRFDDNWSRIYIRLPSMVVFRSSIAIKNHFIPMRSRLEDTYSKFIDSFLFFFCNEHISHHGRVASDCKIFAYESNRACYHVSINRKIMASAERTKKKHLQSIGHYLIFLVIFNLMRRSLFYWQ